MDYKPTTEHEKRQDSDAKIEERWWAERRRCAPNLHAVIDAAQARLTMGPLTSDQRDTLESLMVGLSAFQRNRYELSASDRDENLRLIRDL